MPAAAMQLPAELTHVQARACWQALESHIVGSAASRVEVDASALTGFDSSALAVLLACRRTALAAGKTLVVRALPTGLDAMAALYGVRALLLDEPG